MAETTVITRSLAETNALAASIAESIEPGSIIALTGDLGAGKTAFSKAFALALGITADVTSPTFTLMNIYTLPGIRRGIQRFVHIDAYRIETSEEFEAIGAFDYIGAPATVAIVEWAEKIPQILEFPQLIRISIELGSAGERRFSIER